MPPINEYKCNRCGFALPRGWGGYKYVEVDAQLINARISEKYNEKERLVKIVKAVENLVEVSKGLMQEIENLEDVEGVRGEWGFERFKRVERDLRREIEKVLPRFDVGEIKMIIRQFEERVIRVNNGVLQEIEHLEKEIRELKEIEKELRNREKIRIECIHPGEEDTVEQMLGRNATPEMRKERTGFNSYCMCLGCLHQFEADLRDEKINEWRLWYGYPSFEVGFRGTPTLKDERKCPRCGSSNVKTVFELIGKQCPKCKEGTIEEIGTGIIS